MIGKEHGLLHCNSESNPKLSITGGTARVDLSKEILNEKGATCERLVIKEQISQTLKQFSSVKNVIITVDEKESALDAIKEYEL